MRAADTDPPDFQPEASSDREALPGSVREVVERLDALTDRDRVSVGDILEAFGPTSFIPVLITPALLVVSPLSGIPLFSSLCGITIAMISMQMLLRREHVWLPRFIRHRRIKGRQMHNAARRMRSFADWLDRHSHNRLQVLVTPPWQAIPQSMCVFCGLAMPFLELVPFSSSILGTAVILNAVSFLSRDGLFTLASIPFILTAAAVPMLVFGAVVA